jgi:hypothetical protein
MRLPDRGPAPALCAPAQVRLVHLADCLMLGQLAELARLAVLLAVRQLEAPRKAGLVLVLGVVEDPAAQAGPGGPLTARGPGGLPAWGRSANFASVATAAAANLSRRRSMYTSRMSGYGADRQSMGGGEGPGVRA